ncbi:MAG: hypothetical protein K0S09_3055 [Sphingobacteriaceae bacterium]|jgi:hypothetical protein|nr:hypothetical protein [Sphingobacteriaceae bacterium]
MSSFRRTNSGLNNQHLFYDVDLIVFLEGGKTSYNKTQVYAGNYSKETEDIIFWKNIFSKFKSGKKIKFKSVGSKTTIKEIAVDIIDGKITTVMVAMDNEFDEILNQRINHPNVYYTYGYSWENDVWNQNVIKSVIEELTAIKIDNSDIEANMTEFVSKIKLAVYSDAYLSKYNSSFFPRQTGYMFCVECNPIDLPSIKDAEIEKKIVEKGITKRKATLFGNRYSIDTLKFCFGHFLSDYSCQLITHYIKKRHSLSNIPRDIIYRMGIKKYFEKHFDNGAIYDFYEQQFKKNGA